MKILSYPIISLVKPIISENISADKIFGEQKFFGGQNFRHQFEFSAVLSAEILSDKVSNFLSGKEDYALVDIR